MLIRKNMVRLLLIVVLIAIGFASSPRPALAGTLCDVSGICGRVQNNSSHDLYIYGNKVPGGPFYTYVLHPGQNSTIYLKDTDQVGSPTTNLKVSTPVTVIVGPWQYVKIGDPIYLNCYNETVNGSAGVACYWP